MYLRLSRNIFNITLTNEHKCLLHFFLDYFLLGICARVLSISNLAYLVMNTDKVYKLCVIEAYSVILEIFAYLKLLQVIFTIKIFTNLSQVKW